LEQFKNLTFLIGNLVILEIQDRFKKYYFQKFDEPAFYILNSQAVFGQIFAPIVNIYCNFPINFVL